MGYFKLLFAAGLFWIGTGGVKAQEKILAQDVINPEQLTETFVYWGDQLRVMVPDILNGKKVIRAYHSTLHPTDESMKHYDNDILDYETLRPLVKYSPFGTLRYDYLKDNRVMLTMMNEQDTFSREMFVPYHNYNLRGPATSVLLAALPLKPNFEVDFHILAAKFPYSMENNTEVVMERYNLKVLSEDKVTINNQVFECFVVEMQSDKPGTTYMKSWVTKRSPHEAVKFIYTTKKENGEHLDKKPYVVRGIFKNCN